MTDLPSMLYDAVINKSVEDIKKCVQLGVNVNVISEKDKYPILTRAIWDGMDYEICKLLIDNGAFVNARDKDGDTPLFIAVYLNKPEICELLLKNGADMTMTCRKNKYPLYNAVAYNYLDVVKILLESGANPNILYGNRSLLNLVIATDNINIEIIKLLINYNVNVNYKDIDGNTPLRIALIRDKFDIAIILIKNGADVSICSDNKYSFATIFDSTLLYALDNNQFELAELIIERYNKDVNIMNMASQYSALYLAIKNKRIELAKKIINKGANCKKENNILIDAINTEDNELCEMLINNGCYTNIYDDNTWETPLILAIKKKMVKIAFLLITKKASINKYDRNRKTPLIYAIEQNNIELVKKLLENNASVNKSMFLITTNNEILSLLKLHYKTFSQKYFCLY